MNFLSKLFVAFSFLSLMLITSSCNNIKDIEYIGIKETKLQSIGIQKGTIKVVMQYFNPNKFGIDIKETQLEVYVNDKYIGVADSPERYKIPRNANFDFPIYVHFNPLQALGMASILNASSVNLKVKGSTKAGKSGVYVRVPIEVTEVVKLK